MTRDLLETRGHVELRCAGSGGQGVILMGIILAHAAARDHLHVVQTQSYGPEARGGAVRSDVIISTSPIDYPEAVSLDILVALSERAGMHHLPMLKPEGVLVFDSAEAPGLSGLRPSSFGAPFARLAIETTGKVQSTNVVALGAVARFTDLVSSDSLERAVAKLLPSQLVEMNVKALRRGFRAAEEGMDSGTTAESQSCSA